MDWYKQMAKYFETVSSFGGQQGASARLACGLFFILFVPAIFAPPTFACDCSKTRPTGSCGTLTKTDVIFVGTVVDIENPPSGKREDQEGVSRYRFHVDEIVSGVEKSELDVYSGRVVSDCSYHFSLGQQYLVFPSINQDRFWAGTCSQTRPMSLAAALLQQLRSMRDGKKVASIYGIVYASPQPPQRSDLNETYRPLAAVPISIRSQTGEFKVLTNDHGEYALYDLPPGSYNFTVALPTNLTIDAQAEGSVNLPPRGCYENDLVALPTGMIEGQVLDPNENKLRRAGVELFVASEYGKGANGLWSIQSDEGHFEFKNLSAGDYVLVFNERNSIDTETPFTRSYFPGTPELAHAKIIHLADGEHFAGANIHVSDAKPIRQMTVRFSTEEGRLPMLNTIHVGDQNALPFGTEFLAAGVTKLFLVRGESYVLVGNGRCSWNGPEVTTKPEQISGSEDTPEIKLIYQGNPCRASK
jgi:hypothetical protein